MKVNLPLINDQERLKNKQQFMIITRWPQLPAGADYATQLEHLRRAMDSIEYMQQQFDKGTIVMMHKPAATAGMHTLIAVDHIDELNDFLKMSPAHDRYAEREVIPMANFDSGVETWKNMVKSLQGLAAMEIAAKNTVLGYRAFPGLE